MSLRVGGLFAGYGGLELGLSQVLDCHPAWWSEVDAAPSRVLAHRYPGVPNLGDITRIDWTQAEPVDVITGGSPCQDLSHAGKRLGMKPGTRSGLWAAMCDAIDILRPALVVWENVRGALSAEAVGAVEPCPICVGDERDAHLRALGRVLGDLAELGYDAAWVGLRAADVGAPHGRFRVFVLAWPAADPDRLRGQRGRPARDGRVGPAHGGHAPADTGHGVHGQHGGGVASTTAGGQRWDAGAGRGSAHRDRGVVTWGSREWRDLTLLLPTPAVNDMGAAYTPEQGDAWTERMKTAHGNGNGHGPSLHIEALRMLPTPSAADALGGHERRGGSRGDELLLNGMAKAGHLDRFGPYSEAVARWERVLGRPAPAPTEPTGKDGGHRLSPRFVEFLMGLPDGWVTDVPGITRNHALKALGNGCVPQQVAAAVTHLLEVRRTHALVA